ncbi:MAG: hypothetical protein HYR84_14530, partial [Planctomycetes bacterium]|nr:hypothetical protein [Planctomycetota bacterium]
LQHMKPEQAAVLTKEIDKLHARTDLDEVTTKVLDEASQIVSQSKTDPAGAPKTQSYSPGTDKTRPPPASPVSTERSGAASAGATLDVRIAEAPATETHGSSRLEGNPIQALAALPAELVAQALESESIRTISILINGLDVELAAAIYKQLTPTKRKDVSARFAEQAIVSDALLQRIAEGVVRKCQTMRATTTASSAEPGAREKRMASLLRGLERAERLEMLAVLEASDAELAGRVKSMLYQFEDILKMQNISVQKLLAEIDMKTLAMAVNGVPDALRDKLLGNLSKRAQESLKEEIELSGTIPSSKTKQAQQAIADAIARLDQRGELVMID